MQESLCPLLDTYLELVSDTESPTLFNRWTVIAAVSAILNRRTKIAMPTGPIYPNLYMILIGPPAARKSTAIRLVTNMLREAGYSKIASGNTSAQKFLHDLYKGFDSLGTDDWDTGYDMNSSVLGSVSKSRISDVMICDGELQDFFGINNFDFISLITNLFDNLDYYDNRLKSAKDERIPNPTITLLGGATNTSFKKMFPVEIIGQGLLSRFLLVYGDGPRKKTFMPKPFDQTKYDTIVNYLRILKTSDEIPEVYTLSDEAYEYSRILYEQPTDEITDPRFQYYNGRRNIYYLKLAMIIAACNLHDTITFNDCILANTILNYTEKFMPRALGEFGLDKHAEHTESIYNIIKQAGLKGMTAVELLSQALSIISNLSELSSHTSKLAATSRIDKIQDATGQVRYIAIERKIVTTNKRVDYTLLQEYRENKNFNVEPTKLVDEDMEYQVRKYTEKNRTSKQTVEPTGEIT